MPEMVLLAANPSYQPKSAEDKAAWANAKAKGPIKLDFVTALENEQQSGGLYKIIYENAAAQQAAATLEDRSNKELLEMMLTLGITPQKQMKKTDMIRLIRQRMDGIEVVDDLDGDDPGEQAAS